MTRRIAHRCPAGLLWVAVAAAAAVVSGCSGDDAADATATDATLPPPEVSVTIPPARLTPFCQGMIDLSDRLIDDPPPADEEREIILDAYLDLTDDVPPELAPDFLAVIDALRSGEPAAPIDTTVPPIEDTSDVEDYDAEQRLPTDEGPATHVNAYVDLVCRASMNNPGPPDTQPGEPPPTSVS